MRNEEQELFGWRIEVASLSWPYIKRIRPELHHLLHLRRERSTSTEQSTTTIRSGTTSTVKASIRKLGLA